MTHIPLRNDADPEWREIHEAAERDRAALTRILLVALAAMGSRGVAQRVRQALRFGNIEAAMAAVPLTSVIALRTVLETIFRRAAFQGATVELQSEMVVRLGTSAGLPVGQLTLWARNRSAALIVGVTEQTRQAIRQTLIQALADGLSPARTAPLIERVIGLNTVQARALANRAAELVEQGLSVAAQQSRLAAYAARLIRQRARVIARHELLQAANEGRRAVWRQDVRDGLIAPDRWEREWVAIVPSDGRTCPICIELDGQRAPINGAYPDGTIGPPAHVLCRCTEVLRRTA